MYAIRSYYAQRAERFKVLREEAREIELHFARRRYEELSGESRRRITSYNVCYTKLLRTWTD